MWIRSSQRARNRWRTSRSASVSLVWLVANAVYRMPSRSVIRNCAPGWGISLRTITRIPSGQADRSSIVVMSATQAPSRSTPSLLWALAHPWSGDLGQYFFHRRGEPETDRVGQIPDRGGEPGQECVGAAGGVGADHRGPPHPVACGQLGQGRFGHRHVVCGRIGAGITGPQHHGQWFTCSLRPVERGQRVKPEAFLYTSASRLPSHCGT